MPNVDDVHEGAEHSMIFGTECTWRDCTCDWQWYILEVERDYCYFVCIRGEEFGCDDAGLTQEVLMVKINE